LVGELETLLRESLPNPGDRWPTEGELAERFGVSRIVVREAMKVLEDRGLVEVQAGRGTFTRKPGVEGIKAGLLRLFQNQPVPSLEEMERMLELREVLEETVAGLAAVRATPQDLAEMQAALEGMDRDPSDVEATVQADLRFHLALAHAAHNRFFEIVLEPLTGVFLSQMALTDSFQVGLEHHRRIYEEIRKGNPVAARQAVRRLMRLTASDIRQALGLLQSAEAPAQSMS
jgi:GntR family transcriptional repressor for pyruvate dehydrogenase complex